MEKGRHINRLIVRSLSVILITTFFLTNIVWASPSPTTLAPQGQLTDVQFQEKVMAMEAVLMHPAMNKFQKDQITKEKKTFKTTYKERWEQEWKKARTFVLNISGESPDIQGNIKNDVAYLKEVKVIRLDDVFLKTGQFAAVGLVEKDDNGNPIRNGLPVIYIDNKYYNLAERAALKHDVDEIILWEQLRVRIAEDYGINVSKVDLRGWIKKHVKEADPGLTGELAGLTSQEIAEKFHKEKAYPLKELFKLVAPDEEQLLKNVNFDYIKELYDKFIDEEDNDVSISASVSLAVTPTMEPTYQHYKRILPPGDAADQLVFGTSGIREFVKFLQDKKCYAMAAGLIYYFAEMGEPEAIALAGDYRPSTPDIMLAQIMAGLQAGRKIINGGNIPTPAIVYYGMYRALGPIISLMTTASHCPVLPKEIEQNGFKPNRTTGEVLKEDERRILKQVREALELECMKPENENMYGKRGKLKKKRLTSYQKQLIEESKKLLKEIDDEPRQMYVERYKAFGEIFDESDKVAFIEHMAVGRDIIKEVFGDILYSEERNKKWKKGLVVDTEDVTPGLEKVVRRVVNKYTKKKVDLRGIFTVDGDTDRPALFTEDGTFIYGDKTGYLTCEYLANLQAEKHKKKFVAVTATVSDAVIRKLESIGFEVQQVKIGSPYVVKAIEDRLAKARDEGEEILACGFERNGGFLLGTDITLDNGEVVKALPTRDALLSVMAAFHLVKQQDQRKIKTLGQLVDDRFSDEYSVYSWSGRIDKSDKGCEAYTATMGQAIMRSFSPMDLNITEGKFLEGVKISYLKKDGTRKTVGPEDEFAVRMNGIKEILESYFNEERGFAGGIDRIGFLDGVRIFFKNGEVVHLRPSGNAPQWRIYSEARTLKRAREITDYRCEIYPQMIEEYLKEKKKYEGMHIVARDNDAMKETFQDIFDIGKSYWKTWDMRFGAQKEHVLKEGIDFGKDNTSLTFRSVRYYDVRGELKWLPKEGYTENFLTVERSIIWDRVKNTLTCKEEWSDGREVSVQYEGHDAWLEIGRGLDKNIPMGKFADMPFPVMSDNAKKYFKEQGIYWLDLFDVVAESELTAEPPMWKHNFNFQKEEKLDIPEEDAGNALTLFKDKEEIPAKLEQDHYYVIRYDAAKLSQYKDKFDLSDESSPEALLKAYVNYLRLRVPQGKDAEKVIRLQSFDGKTEHGPSLISVIHYDSQNREIGIRGNVNIEDFDQLTGGIRIIGMLNMALAASNIPKGADLKEYTKLVSYIQNQYKVITGQDLTRDSIFKVIVIPAAEPVPINRLKEYYELTLQHLHSV